MPCATATAGRDATEAAATARSDVLATPDEIAAFSRCAGRETLTGIARRYGVSPDTLRALNNIGNADFILVGQQLRIAAATAEPTVAATGNACADRSARSDGRP